MSNEFLLAKAAGRSRALTRRELTALLTTPDAEALFAAAREVRYRQTGRKVFCRGLLEFSNVCAKNCLYCGIRRGNREVRRYRMERGEILEAVGWAIEAGYGNVVLQSGEVSDEASVSFVEDLVSSIRSLAGSEFGITLSLGEQTPEVYRRWKQAGAHRYLLRIETSNSELYASLHPADHSWAHRVECLRALRTCGYQVGSGVMVGLPGQTVEDLAADIEFFAKEDFDMIGMGPYVPHLSTPVGRRFPWSGAKAAYHLELGLRMIAVTRLYLHEVNIAAATALQALDPKGRERGLLAGANVIMPNVTPVRYRAEYALYAGKPCLGESPLQCRGCLARRVASTGGAIAWNERGDSPRWRVR